MNNKELTPMQIARRRYEERNKEERKKANAQFSTFIPRATYDEINTFLKKYDFTKVQLIEEGYKSLVEQAAESDLSLGKIIDGYDDVFGFESETSTKDKKK